MSIESASFTTAYYVQRLKSQYKVHLLCTIGFIVIPECPPTQGMDNSNASRALTAAATAARRESSCRENLL